MKKRGSGVPQSRGFWRTYIDTDLCVQGIAGLRVSSAIGFAPYPWGHPAEAGTRRSNASDQLQIKKFMQIFKTRVKSWQTRHATGAQDTKNSWEGDVN